MKLLLKLALASMIAFPAASSAQSPIQKAGTFLRDVYTLHYLDGQNGKYRNASFMQKIVRQPGRAFITAAVYGVSLIAAKQLYDFADKQGFFEELKASARRATQERTLADYREWQRERFEQDLGERRAPEDYRDRQLNQIRIANPFRGHQLHVQGIPQLPGFYHMRSDTPYHDLHDGCGVNAVYNMAHVEAQLFNRNINQQEFERTLRAIFPDAGYQGANDQQVVQIAEQLRLAPVIALGFNDRGVIQRLGRVVQIPGNVRDHERYFEDALVQAAEQDVAQAAQQFRRGNGAQAVHFLCGIPGHWIAICVIRNAQNQQAMYLYDNLNNRPDAVAHMRMHIENIYNRFF